MMGWITEHLFPKKQKHDPEVVVAAKKIANEVATLTQATGQLSIEVHKMTKQHEEMNRVLDEALELVKKKS
jgi:hypothetical protein